MYYAIIQSTILLSPTIRLSAVFLALHHKLCPLNIRSRDTKVGSHHHLHVLGKQHGVLLLILGGLVDWQELECDTVDRVGHDEQDGVDEPVVLVPGPGGEVVPAVPDGDGLYRLPRFEPSSLEADESLAVGGGALCEYEYLRPREGGAGSGYYGVSCAGTA